MGQPDLSRQEQAVREYTNGYYGKKLEEGLRFQDRVTDILYDNGMVVVTYVSKARGLKAENKLGVEIKRDGKFRESGNLYIETAEKSHPANACFVDSGIFREDNSWLYLIGDEVTLWVFAKKLLQEIARSPKRRFTFTETPTSRGFLMPVAHADRWCALKLPKDQEDR